MVSFRLWKKKEDEPISKVLKQLQTEINNHEIRTSSLRQKQRSIKGQTTLYSVLIYLTYVLYYALGRHYHLHGQTVVEWSVKIGIMLVFPALVYGVRTGVTWWFTRKIEREMHQKEVLKTRLDEKIEELKEKSDYYNTQQLLERYDSKALPRSTSDEKFHDPAQSQSPQLKSSSEGIRRQPSIDTLRQRGNSRALLPQLPPPITPASFVSPKPQNIPQFHPSAFSPPPSPSLAPQELRSKTFLDRVLDLLVGEDENAADHRYALICRHCRAHNGLAPPGERGEDVGYLCGRCGGWNGPDPNKKEQSTPKDEESQAKDGQAEDREEAVDNLIQNKEKDKGNGKDIEQHGANLSA